MSLYNDTLQMARTLFWTETYTHVMGPGVIFFLAKRRLSVLKLINLFLFSPDMVAERMKMSQNLFLLLVS